tara:strand:+ start:566 stop:712 length:147 start_codon:yes stop_codon:yes gene_type:complete
MQIIRASEIGEFYYCNLSWWLRKKGNNIQTPQQIVKKLKTAKPEEKLN